MNIVCVDDEIQVLGLVVYMCRELAQKPEVEGFTEPEEALDYIKRVGADIAILDINMPKMNGITLAMKIKEVSSDTDIIFLTAYEEFAIDAFKMHASGYVLKPVNRERLQSEIDHIASVKPVSYEHSEGVFIRTFGDFDVFKDGRIVKFARSKSKELLAYLVDRQGCDVSRPEIFSVLSEDKLYDRKMQKQFDVIIRSLKETLKEYGIEEIFEQSGGRLRVCPENFLCDMYLFLNGDARAVNAYRGEYMSSYPWARLTEGYISRFEGGQHD